MSGRFVSGEFCIFRGRYHVGDRGSFERQTLESNQSGFGRPRVDRRRPVSADSGNTGIPETALMFTALNPCSFAALRELGLLLGSALVEAGGADQRFRGRNVCSRWPAEGQCLW